MDFPHAPSPIGPSVLFSTAPFFLRTTREAFEHAARAGFEAVEVMVTRDKDSQEAERLQALAERYDLRIGAIHAPFLIVSKWVWGSNPVGKIQKAASLAEAVEAPIVVAHPPCRWQAGYRAWLRAGELDRLQADFPATTITMENMFPMGLDLHAASTEEQLGRFRNLTLDTSHAGVSGLDISAAPAHFGARLRHVHLSNNTGRGRDSHARLQEGVLPIPAFLEQLGENGFSGAVSLELDLRPWMDDESALREVLSSQRRFVEPRIAAPAPVPAIRASVATSLARA